jgi:hypothetical protein
MVNRFPLISAQFFFFFFGFSLASSLSLVCLGRMFSAKMLGKGKGIRSTEDNTPSPTPLSAAQALFTTEDSQKIQPIEEEGGDAPGRVYARRLVRASGGSHFFFSAAAGGTLFYYCLAFHGCSLFFFSIFYRRPIVSLA